LYCAAALGLASFASAAPDASELTGWAGEHMFLSKYNVCKGLVTCAQMR
jgi:hypothetical protein